LFAIKRGIKVLKIRRGRTGDFIVNAVRT